MNGIIQNIRLVLKKKSDKKVRESAQRFFKEKVRHYGVNSAEVGVIAKESFKALANKEKTAVFALCEELWKSDYMEEGFVACDWSYRVRKEYEASDLKVFERWVSRYVDNWASCDTLCNHSVGELVEMYPSCLAGLKKWARSKNRWMKRAAAVSLIIPARRGKFLKDIFEIADILLEDADDMVQKGYGWMLKAASQAHESEVFDYVSANKAAMPRTALRYAIEKMPKELKLKAMRKG
jgi:3-methyladenine DNA glycosylase AlkD